MAKRQGSFLVPNKKKEYKPRGTESKNENLQKKEGFKKSPNKRQEEFDKNRPGVEDEHSGGKKPFDKKTYRLKKYSKKYKLEQWEEQRKQKLLRNYYKDVKNEPLSGSYKPKTFDEDTTDGAQVGRFVRHPDLIAQEDIKSKSNRKKDAFWRAKEQFNKIKDEKKQQKLAAEITKIERTKKLDEYKKKKQERFKKLSKKNKKGQPMMTGRLELLLDKIQNNPK